jgi:hypothetical protein
MLNALELPTVSFMQPSNLIANLRRHHCCDLVEITIYVYSTLTHLHSSYSIHFFVVQDATALTDIINSWVLESVRYKNKPNPNLEQAPKRFSNPSTPKSRTKVRRQTFEGKI